MQNNLVKRIWKPIALGITTAVLAVSPYVSNAQTSNALLDSVKYYNNEIKENKADTCGNFIYVPAIDAKVAKEISHYGKNWNEAHKALNESGNKMLTIPEFQEFLKYVKVNFPEIYNGIIKSDKLQAEWLDADFKLKGKDLYINYNHILDSNGDLIPQNSEVLDKNTLMQDEMFGFSLEDWLNNSTKQGFPTEKSKKQNFQGGENIYFWYPRSDNNSVARFDASPAWADLSCSRDPLDAFSSLGVRATKLRE